MNHQMLIYLYVLKTNEPSKKEDIPDMKKTYKHIPSGYFLQEQHVLHNGGSEYEP